MEAGNLVYTEFKTLVISMLSELRGRIDELSENFNKEMGNIKTTRKYKEEPLRNQKYIN